MKFVALFSLLVLALVAPDASHGQTLPGAASALRGNLRALVQEVKEQVPEHEGRKDIVRELEKSRVHLEEVRDRATHSVPRRRIAPEIEEAGEHFRAAASSLGDNRSRVRSELKEVNDGFQRLSWAWRAYAPAEIEGLPVYTPVPELTSRDEAARRIATRHLARRFNVSPRSVQVTRFDQRRNRYKVYARVPGIGSYVVDLDAVGGTVFSAMPLR